MADQIDVSARVTPGARSRDDGFTLIELLIVILIIGILAAIAIPSFLDQKGKADDTTAKEVARTAAVAAETYATDHTGKLHGHRTGSAPGIRATPADRRREQQRLPERPPKNRSGQGYIVTAVAPASE